jgi:hypothetical protein
MKKYRIPFFYGPLFALLLTCCLAVAADKPELQKLRYSILSSTSEQVVLQFNGSYSPKVFTLKGETPRVVFDFPGVIHGREIKSITPTDGAIVKRIRVGMHKGDAQKTRVVFDLATLKNLTHTQQLDEKSSTLTIRFNMQAKTGAAPKKTIADTPESPAQSLPAKETPPVVRPAAPEKKSAPQPAAPSAQTEKKTTAPVAQVQPESTITPKLAPTAQAAPADNDVTAKNQTKQPTPQTTATAEVASEKKTTAMATTRPQPNTKAESTIGAALPEKVVPTAASSVTASKPLLETITFDGKSPKGEMVMFKLNGFYPPDIHGIEKGIPRVFCDFKNTGLQDGNTKLIKTNGKHVKLIRIDKLKNPEKVRVVLDLEPKQSYDLQQVFFREDNLFVIIVNTVKH